MGIHPASADLVTARLREVCLSETGKERADNHHGTTELRTLPDKVLTHDIVAVNLVRLECVHSLLMTGHLDSHAFQKKYQVLDVQNLRNVRNLYGFLSQKHRTDDLQRLILGALRPDSSAELISAFYYK